MYPTNDMLQLTPQRVLSVILTGGLAAVLPNTTKYCKYQYLQPQNEGGVKFAKASSNSTTLLLGGRSSGTEPEQRSWTIQT